MLWILSLTKIIGDEYGQRFLDQTKRSGINAFKTPSKRINQ